MPPDPDEGEHAGRFHVAENPQAPRAPVQAIGVAPGQLRVAVIAAPLVGDDLLDLAEHLGVLRQRMGVDIDLAAHHILDLALPRLGSPGGLLRRERAGEGQAGRVDSHLGGGFGQEVLQVLVVVELEAVVLGKVQLPPLPDRLQLAFGLEVLDIVGLDQLEFFLADEFEGRGVGHRVSLHGSHGRYWCDGPVS